jgi:uncharacterized membrane protein
MMPTRGFLGGVGVGVALGYFLDPERGVERRRRAAAVLGRLAADRYGARLSDLAGLEAANLPPARGRHGSSTGPTLLAGALLTAYGLTRRGRAASAARAMGAGLLGRGWRPRGAAGSADRRRVIDIQKTIHIAAPVAEVYAFWDSYETYPLLFSAVREIQDLGGGRSRWVVSGPRGGFIEWDAVVTRREPGRLLAWRSEPGSMLDHAGVVRFSPERGGTRVDLRICYQSLADGGARAVRDLLGADPRAQLNEDLARLTALLEGTARSGRHGQESRS